MKIHVLPRTIRAIISGGAASLSVVSYGLMLSNAHADDAKVERVEVTGSSIKGVAAQSASPITIIKTEELAKMGITTASEALSRVSGNQSQFTASSAVGQSGTIGASADMRGLGSNKTLVLLNGRRLPNSPFEGSSVDLNIIPIAALDRIEILRDGASAIYGTDAIGGVINFITKKSYQGLTTTFEGSLPTRSGGGSQTRFNITGGYGDLNQDGYNLFGIADFHQQQPLNAADRSFTSAGGIRPDLGMFQTSGSGYPANFYDPGAGPKDDSGKALGLSGNPYAAAGCVSPHSIPQGGACRYNYASVLGIVPQTKQTALLGKGTLKIDDNNQVGIEYLHAETQSMVYQAANPFASGEGFFLPSTSKYYPGNGITPAFPGLSGQDLTLGYRSELAGRRQDETLNKADRLLFSAEGNDFGWDYKTGVSLTRSTQLQRLVEGFLNDDLVRGALENGTLNPFGPQAAGDEGIYSQLALRGPYLDAKATTAAVDFTASREIAQLPAGGVGLAVGTSWRHENSAFNVYHDVANLSSGTGYAGSQSIAGHREVSAVFTELQVPILKSLEAQFALRYDNYSDVGSTTNPKVAFRWQPLKELMFRTSYSTGFRAPSLYELNQPPTRVETGSSQSDPILCPGGVVAPSGIPSRDCNQQMFKLKGGSKDLQPEKSRSFTVGTVVEPMKDLTLSVDYWNILLKNQITQMSESLIFGDGNKYAADFVRNPDGSLNYILNPNLNLGNVRTSGIDLGFGWKLPETAWGRFGLTLDGTYVNQYDYQIEQGGEYISNLGKYGAGVKGFNGGGGAIFRWRHTAGINWSLASWSAAFQQTFQSGYLDQNTSADSGYDNHHVGSYTIYNLSGTYSGIKNLTLTLGIKNLFNKNPPASNTTDNYQFGYDPRYADPLGRVLFLRGTYKFL